MGWLMGCHFSLRGTMCLQSQIMLGRFIGDGKLSGPLFSFTLGLFIKPSSVQLRCPRLELLLLEGF
ncbi:hypothetical protein PVE_P0094 (plasmid) [Pseudomonas veronii 1YdBTEX2]|uniref:Uncharacterized protein n=1 Tax=Pseudomonas veronii 1YdBTEX2 TaxID=1295141 RepID=A0A1D3KA01_PSEVE|nr:hypothetical protein PVE_P0094 [Pseudomonas veronii 1YdBTEX2]